MGKVFDLDWEPIFGSSLPLTNFSQLLTSSSGRVEVTEIINYFKYKVVKE